MRDFLYENQGNRNFVLLPPDRLPTDGNDSISGTSPTSTAIGIRTS
jgi:hypothetical protein